MKFVAASKGHNVESIKGMIPADAAPFAGKVSEDFTVAFGRPGVYGVKCLPHYALGMVALIVVGTPANQTDAIGAAHPGRAKHVFATLFAKAQLAAK